MESLDLIDDDILACGQTARRETKVVKETYSISEET